ncbi:MAG TPA: sigma 54-interacting transcriptional regulator [Thermoanaerobaculia bacterium]|nr:sigma 54-interacting transcriptional regulator [Thermoanaerobaculia bacterium]
MSPRLIAVSGPLAGQTFALGTERLTLGRDHGNTVHLRDLAVSRHHCELEADGGRFRLRDLDSRHGTFVNGVPVRERDLEPGDLIALGGSLFLFQTREEEATAPPDSVLLDGASFTAGSTSQFVPAESRYLRPEAIQAALPPEARTARDLQALLRIGNDLHSLHSTEPIARRLLELALETIPAERATVLLFDADTAEAAEPNRSFALDRRGSAAPFGVSRTLVERIVAEGTAVLANDVPEETGGWGVVESVVAARLQSLIAAPLTGEKLTGDKGPSGVLYLDTRNLGTRFDERHLDLLTAVAGIASAALANARLLEWLREENQRIEAALDTDMVGESSRMKEIGRLLARVAPTDSTVLLRGESGTGKEVAARSLHRGSRRVSRPFVAINCATLSETLLESELFGHEKGAFTGAVDRKTGKIEAAEGGTLFLDEVGELPPKLQAKLLRVLQEREYERVGGTRPLKADVRVVAATNRDLEKAMREGTFREDLFYRLNVITLTLPTLRERREDITLLASHFAALFSRRLGRRIAGFTPEARSCLQRYGWPGNVRELANAIERALVLGEGELIRPEDLPETVLETAPAAATAAGPIGAYHESVNDFKRRLILDALDQAGGNVTKAAERLDLNPTYLHRLISNLELRDRS